MLNWSGPTPFIWVVNVEEFVGDSNFAALLVDTLGLAGVPSTRVETASSTGAALLKRRSTRGLRPHENVLVLAGKK